MDQEDKNQSTDRIISLVKVEGKNTLSDMGLIDNRLFSGGNTLHAVMEPNGLWILKYDSGSLPEPLRQQFTNFTILMKFLRQYFHKRNIEIKEVIS